MKSFVALFLILVFSVFSAHAAPTHTVHIKVDQFGYRPDREKVAVLSDPQQGFNASESYTPGATLEVRDARTHVSVFSGPISGWNSGATDSTYSGDKIWYFDFSRVQTPGEYYVYDATNDMRSDHFRIAENVYNDASQQALRTFFYQRRGFSKEAPYADPKWADGASHLQDIVCRDAGRKNNAATERDLSGGWYDAGDYNKYVNWGNYAAADLMHAYVQNPDVWGDNLNIPESGNGIPDIMDEVKWELDWLLKMQLANGAVSSKAGAERHGNDPSPPSADTNPCYYGAPTTSATASTAGSFALGASTFNALGMTSYASTLTKAAENAWVWIENNPGVQNTNNGFSTPNPDDQYPYGKDMFILGASVYLYALTGKQIYHDYLQQHYQTAKLITNPYYISPWRLDKWINDALMYYLKLPDTDNTIAAEIQSAFNGIKTQSHLYGGHTTRSNPYRVAVSSPNDYTWGSNEVHTTGGWLIHAMIELNLDPANHDRYKDAACNHLHYIHGVNPMARVYLSNMGGFGSERSVDEFFHAWFADGTIYDNVQSSTSGPAPGYLTGGPNQNYAVSSVSPPYGQPPMKAYKDWNAPWWENPWEINENAIYYQASYIRLVSKFISTQEVTAPAAPTGLTVK